MKTKTRAQLATAYSSRVKCNEQFTVDDMSPANRTIWLLPLLMIALTSGCSKPDPELSSTERMEIAIAADSYYKASPIGGGWTVEGLKVVGSALRVRVIIPHAAGIMSNAPESQFRAVSVACPGRLEPIWSQKGLGDIVIEGLTPKGDAFIDVSCKRWGL